MRRLFVKSAILITVLLLMSSCSWVKTDHNPGNAGHENKAEALSEPYSDGFSGRNPKVVIKDTVRDTSGTDVSSGRMTASKYANFEDTIDKLIDIVKE